jgi:uncharacterized membrane protein YcaP (DUF421 family)
MSWFDLSMPWWMFVARGVTVYVGVLVLVRLSGKLSLGDMSPFNILMLIFLGSLMRTAVLGEDHSLLGPFIAVATILALDKALGVAASRWPRCNRLLEGVPTLLARRGVQDSAALRRSVMPQEVFARALRAHGLHGVDEVEEARLEPNGQITVIRRDPD